MYDANWSRIFRYLIVFEESSSVVGYFVITKADDFDEVCNRIDACEGIKAHFLLVNCNMPMTYEDDVYFIPRRMGALRGASYPV